MADDILQSKLDEIDRINNVLRELILKIYNKLEKNNIDDETNAFFIDLIDSLENSRVDLKNLNVSLIENFLTSRQNRSKLLCQSLLEVDEIQKEQKQMQLQAAQYFESRENPKETFFVRH